MHIYRSHTCGELRNEHTKQIVRLSGWIHRKRNHGQVLFIDLRDNYGITQLVVSSSSILFELADQSKIEDVVTVTGTVITRTPETINSLLPTGEIEVQIAEFKVQSKSKGLPFPVNLDIDIPEELRLKYRFLDFRREKTHRNILLRSKVISSLRKRMTDSGFIEFQTPILTSSSPEGARDFLVPSRVHPGKFYALPQAPQQFKQLLMVGGFDRYFQIAPCFRDEDARADRSPGEFYQLDFEMSFVTQEDVFSTIEPILHGIFEEFSRDKKISPAPFPQIPYEEAMLTYGSDKPDLRNPLIIVDVSKVFKESTFTAFTSALEKGHVIRAIRAPNSASKPRSWFDGLNGWAQDQGAKGLGYIVFSKVPKGPILKFLNDQQLELLRQITDVKEDDVVFFICDAKLPASKLAGSLRQKLGQELDLFEKDAFRFCWIVDFPMYEINEETGKIDFSHNPFSMPQGGLEALNTQDPLTIKAFQYDIVCNGIELSSGAIRNHLPEIMYKAFEIAGYSASEVETKFGGMLEAFKFGAPPHGGSAPGIDRIVMILADTPNIREIVAFPLNQRAEDLLMQAPSEILQERLNELHIRLKPSITKEK